MVHNDPKMRPESAKNVPEIDEKEPGEKKSREFFPAHWDFFSAGSLAEY